VYREPNGTVWAGTLHRGLSRLRNGTWHTFTTKDGLPSDRISVITGNESGLIFVGTPNGLAQFKNDRWTSYNTHDGLPPGAIESFFWMAAIRYGSARQEELRSCDPAQYTSR
jgi:ligand-binding sensor domain-containing protein